ncbi:hypothetical protein APTSU1_000423800 [Apodemus speciosus]|uniref:Uncharacterized protein n=1 Tax=Apodemus speciosus TaxID=105296 RepID=A0ABQ0EPP3_APOSI
MEPAAKEADFSISAMEARFIMTACAVIIQRPAPFDRMKTSEEGDQKIDKTRLKGPEGLHLRFLEESEETACRALPIKLRTCEGAIYDLVYSWIAEKFHKRITLEASRILG